MLLNPLSVCQTLIRKCFWADGWDAHQFCKSLLFPSLLMIFVSKHHIVLGILYTFKVLLHEKKWKLNGGSK